MPTGESAQHRVLASVQKQLGGRLVHYEKRE
jgi:hypothetical protein